jgi:hypothetical protein
VNGELYGKRNAMMGQETREGKIFRTIPSGGGER